MDQLTVSISPHIYGVRNTRSVMLDVVIALLPASIASVVIFGWRSLAVLAVSVGLCVLFEFLFNKLCKKRCTIGDFSAVVTGVLLALNCPSTIPLWQVGVGALVAIVVVKGLFGGLGQNFANPAIAARVVMLLSFSGTMVNFADPVISPIIADTVSSSTVDSATHATADAVSSATPLAAMGGHGTLPSLVDMLFGIHGGSMGETCAIALIIGGIYLMVRRVISWRTPVAFVATVFLFTLIVGGDITNSLYHVLSGGLLIGAIFMATDYATTPITDWGKIVFGIGCGIFTCLIRLWGNYPEGVSFAILFMNILTPYIEKWTAKKPFGGVQA